jgi:hypothetical protein
MDHGAQQSCEKQRSWRVETLSSLTSWQNVLMMVDFPVPARPASQKIDMDGDEDDGTASQERISLRTSSRVFSRQPSGESRELYRAAYIGLRLLRVS